MSQRKRYALVGTGGRAVMYVDGIYESFAEHAELVGFCDVSPTRMAWHNRRLETMHHAKPVPTFTAGQFDEMIRQTRPDVVIVTSVDSTHHQYIIRAMELGCDAICEKPLATDEGKAAAILAAMRRTGRALRVTFNYRYVPHATKLRELMMQHTIGTPLHVDFTWLLDTSHGADYFRRWHRDKASSGGLLVHKSSHHFDLVNWWLDASPQSVFAMGGLKFYGRKNAESRGERYSYSRYTGQPEARKDPFALVLDGEHGEGVYSSHTLKGLYLDAEQDSGYVRDQNVFGDGITSEDTMSLLVQYDSGVIMNYTLLTYAPWEGFRIGITGDKGRIELNVKHGAHIIAGQSEQELADQQSKGNEHSLRVLPMFGIPYEVPTPTATGGHGGSDPALLKHLFVPEYSQAEDPFGRAAGFREGLDAIRIGIAGNRSMETGLPVDCDQLFSETSEAKPTITFEKHKGLRKPLQSAPAAT